MLKRYSIVAVGSILLGGCSGLVGDTGTTAAASQDSLVLFHTSTGIFSLKRADLAPSELKERADQFYPAICVDSDSDGDRVPDELDDDSDDREDHRDDSARVEGGDDERHSDCGHSGGGSKGDTKADAGTRDAGRDDDEGRLHHCEVCNRGPGQAGDFRFEVKGPEGRLERGRVFSRVGATITVASPNGPVTITTNSATRVRGEPTPGSDIRVRGVVQGTRSVLAVELEVLCPGPTPLPPDQLPPGTNPVPPPPPPATDGGIVIN